MDRLQDLRDAGLIPGAVTMAVLPLTWIPKAPLLRDDASPADDADALWAAWQTVATHRGVRGGAGHQGWSRRGRTAAGRGALEQLTSVPEAALRLCAEALRAEHLEPVAWVSWSWDAWTQMRGTARKPPPLRWVFSAQRVQERHGWCRSETGRFRTMRAERWPREAREHAERVRELHRRVARLDPVADRAQVLAELEAVFLDGPEASLRRAQAALGAQAEAVREDLAAGVFLWR